MRKKIKASNDDPIKLLEKSIPKPVACLDIDYVKMDEVYKIMNDMKSTNTCRYDQFSARIIMMIPQIVSLWMMHGINLMIMTETFKKSIEDRRTDANQEANE